MDLRKLEPSDLRLDAIHYAPAYRKSKAALANSGLKTRTLGSFAAEPPFTLNRFRRVWVQDPEKGHPYLAPHELLKFKPFRERYVSKKLTEEAERFFVKRGWLLITASGTVGVPLIASRQLESFFLSHDLIRIVPKKDAPIGYLYAWIASKVAQPLFLRQEYGGTIKHLEAHQITELPVPIIPDDETKEINAMIRRAWALREEANELEQQAIDALEKHFVTDFGKGEG